MRAAYVAASSLGEEGAAVSILTRLVCYYESSELTGWPFRVDVGVMMVLCVSSFDVLKRTKSKAAAEEAKHGHVSMQSRVLASAVSDISNDWQEVRLASGVNGSSRSISLGEDHVRSKCFTAEGNMLTCSARGLFVAALSLHHRHTSSRLYCTPLLAGTSHMTNTNPTLE